MQEINNKEQTYLERGRDEAEKIVRINNKEQGREIQGGLGNSNEKR